MAPKVLVSDKLSEKAVQIFRDRGIEVTFDPEIGKDKDKLLSVIGEYDGLAIRSATKVSDKVLAAAPNLKVIGRAGIGVDNVDISAASKQGVIVMNTPFGNSITTAEHAIAMMMSLARQIPEANASTQAGKWEKSRFMGVELTGKTLGLIGAGNIGSIVADRARGLRMKVLAYDPFLSEERATKLGVTRVELDELLSRADFVTLHVPFTDKTKNILSRDAIAKMKPGARIINCARGGLVDEGAAAEALTSGHLAGAAFDVFAEEPATENPLFGLPNVVCTPHLGAATTEAQENVALQVAEQMSDYLLTGAVQNALNMPSVTAEEAAVMGPWMKLVEHLGGFAGQMTDEPITAINILYDGTVTEMNLDALHGGAAPDAQPRRRVAIGVDVEGHTLRLEPLDHGLGKGGGILDRRIGEFQAHRGGGTGCRVGGEMRDPVALGDELGHFRGVGVGPLDERLAPADRPRPVERQEIILHGEHRRRVDRRALENALVELAALGHAKDLGQRPGRGVILQPRDGARRQDQNAMRRLAAHNLLPGEGRHIELVPGQLHREGRRGRIAQRQPLAVRRDHRAVGHAHARGRAVPGEADIAVVIERGHVHDLAVIGLMDTRIELELLDRVGHPAGAEALPGDHLDRALSEQRPHRHLEGAGVGGGHDPDAVIVGHAEDLAGAVDRGLELGLARLGAVRAPERGVTEAVERECGDLGAGAGREIRVCRPHGRFRRVSHGYPSR